MDDRDDLNGRAVWRRSSHCADNTCVEVASLDGHVLVRDSKDRSGPVLEFSGREWAAFVRGVRDGEFEAL
jgi:hypothetical protein